MSIQQYSVAATHNNFIVILLHVPIDFHECIANYYHVLTIE